ncbi:mitochondrial import inner membrane translocase subunit Tim13 [Brevipalpus obovatus]|uniref:mitochondrial import inner membrane translocase subunit Tim13 n=1 Tax=Brevipalpus obovatus TaxID=246614 RepID=UPI003D9F0152
MTEQLSAAEKAQLIDKVKQEIAIANVSELLKSMTDKCFRKCVTKPGISIDSSENKCLSFCTDRYIDTWNLVTRVYSNRIQRESGGGGISSLS